MEGIIVDIIVDIKLRQSSIWSLSIALYRALRELYREPLVEPLAELFAEPAAREINCGV